MLLQATLLQLARLPTQRSAMAELEGFFAQVGLLDNAARGFTTLLVLPQLVTVRPRCTCHTTAWRPSSAPGPPPQRSPFS